MAQLVGMSTHNRKVASLIPGPGTYDPWSQHVWEATNQCFSLSSMFLSLPSSLSKSSRKCPNHTMKRGGYCSFILVGHLSKVMGECDFKWKNCDSLLFYCKLAVALTCMTIIYSQVQNIFYMSADLCLPFPTSDTIQEIEDDPVVKKIWAGKMTSCTETCMSLEGDAGARCVVQIHH